MPWQARVDGVEARLARMARPLRRPGVMHGVAVGFVVLALLLRLPLVFAASDVPDGHNDANIYFNQVYVFWLRGDFYPDADRGSGWQLLLYLTLETFGVEPGAWYGKHVVGDAGQRHAALLAYALSAMLTVGVVAATYLLARLLLSPALTVGALALVTFDPYLMFISTSAMSEPPYTALLVLSLACAIKARERPAWVLGVALLMAGGHVMRVNGLVMFVMALAFALALMRAPRAARVKWAAVAVATFLVAVSPYLAWREIGGPGAFEYGTNQRFWADNLWDMSDPYWTARNAGDPTPPKETMSDWFATHSLVDTLSRLYRSVQWQFFDLFGYGKWPGGEPEGGIWPGTPRDGSALTPLVVALSLVAAFTVRDRRWLFVPLALAFTVATFVWIYPLVRSVRYFAPLIPLFLLFAMAGWGHLASRVRWPFLASAGLVALYVGLYGVRPLVAVPFAFDDLARHAEVAAIVGSFLALWTLVVLLPILPALVRRLRGRAGASADAESG